MAKQKARCFGQDLMRGEHVVGGGRKAEKGKAFKSQGRLLALQKTGDSRIGTTSSSSKAMQYAGGYSEEQQGTGTSIFDPVLCELMYRWFCPTGGQVVDPFAGGSVRGIVAGVLGLHYWGCDLRAEQIAANEEQRDNIARGSVPGVIPITVSGASLRQMFHPCTEEYVTGVCHGRCCQGTGKIMVTVHESERNRIEALGCEVRDGFILADRRGLCPFKTDEGRCSIHDRKPFGCAASPFTLNKGDTLVVRNRYRLLRCYKADGAEPAYAAHRFSLTAVLGKEEAERVSELAAAGGEAIASFIDADKYAMLKDNDDAKRGAPAEKSSSRIGTSLEQGNVLWACGDALDLLDTAPPADLIFTCPPYGDLETYSDDPKDLSNMPFDSFLSAYRKIIHKAAAVLKDNSFACFVVGDYRDKKTGAYRVFVSETVRAFQDAGLCLYNDAVLVTAVGSLPIRCGKQFVSGRKLGKTHQNVLVFYKGDPRQIAPLDIDLSDVDNAMRAAMNA